MGIIESLTSKEKAYLLSFLLKSRLKEKSAGSSIIKNYIFYDEKVKLKF